MLELIRGAQCLIEVIRSSGEEMWRVDAYQILYYSRGIEGEKRTHSRFADWTMGFTYDFYANRWRVCSISYYFRNSSASINNVTNVNYDIDLQKMYMYSCKMPEMLCLTRWG